MSDLPRDRAELLASGLRFECQGSGHCCTARDGYGYVYLSLADRRRLAKHLELPTAAFTRRHCEKTEGLYHLKGPEADCRFLEGRRCSIYPARPEQCRAWPFWTENLEPGVWHREVLPACAGAGRGPRFDPATIERIAAASDVQDYD